MNKKFKLTDKVTKESIRSPEFKRWLMRTLAVVCIISLIFQFSTCVYQGLNAYAADDPVDGGGSVESAVGIYILNERLTYTSVEAEYSIDYNFHAVSDDGTVYDYDRNTLTLYTYNNSYSDTYHFAIGFGSYGVKPFAYSNGDSSLGQSYGNWLISYYGYPYSDVEVIISITGGADIYNPTLISWLNINTVKQAPPIVHDFTNEIRVFNDQLTFFITDQASWANVFYFDYEILGLGVCDYLSLQRTTSNQYLMGYNVVSDGADGYLHTSYRYYVAQSRGGFLRENYKTIRFISNPDDTDLQQWLLDNTTLIGTVGDQETFDLIYDMGFDVGYNSGYEQGFANSLIGDSLSGPINALSSITLIQIGDTVITLGGVIMTAIALCLVLAFLKLYAGG